MPADPLQVPVRRLEEAEAGSARVDVPVPRRMRAGDAGADLSSAIELVIDPGQRAVVPTAHAVAIPERHAGLVLSRSGLAVNHGIAVLNAPGLIDSGYRGELKVILINHGAEPVTIERGQRIAQLVVVDLPDLVYVTTDVLPDGPDERGEAGFGSSG